MRRFLVASLLAALGSLATPSEARADVYDDFLAGLRSQIDGASSFGFDVEELRRIGATVEGRPQIASEGSYESYVRLLGDLSERFASFGYDGPEMQVLETVARAHPLPGQPVEASRYGAFLGAVGAHVERAQTFGFDADEMQVLALLLRAQPGLALVPGQYEPAYSTWQRTLRDTEQRFSPFGIDAQEGEVLAKLRSVQPKLGAVPTPGRPPSWPPREPWGRPERPLRVCGQTFRGAVQAGGPATTVTTILLDDGDLVQVDGRSCQVRWLGDGVVSVGLQPSQRSGTFQKQQGAYSFAGNDVFEIVPDTARAPAAPGFRGEGRPRGGRYRYSVRWQPLDAAGPF